MTGAAPPSLDFDAFAAKWDLMNPWRRRTYPCRREQHPSSDAWLASIDKEIADMRADRSQVERWEDVVPGTRVFVRWPGGNRGVYLRHAKGLGPPAEERHQYRHALPAIGEEERWCAQVWSEAPCAPRGHDELPTAGAGGTCGPS